MARLADGDRGAFEPLFAALHPRAIRLARMRLGASDADDAAQQALLRVFARASEFTPGRPAIPWFYAIAANEIHALARRRARAHLREAQVEAAEQDSPPRTIRRRSSFESDAPRDQFARRSMTLGPRIESARCDPCAPRRRAPGPDAPRPPALRKRVSRAYALAR